MIKRIKAAYRAFKNPDVISYLDEDRAIFKVGKDVKSIEIECRGGGIGGSNIKNTCIVFWCG